MVRYNGVYFKGIHFAHAPFIHNFSANSHLIKVHVGHVASMGVPGFRCENTPFGWQKAHERTNLVIVICFEASVFLRCFMGISD